MILLQVKINSQFPPLEYEQLEQLPKKIKIPFIKGLILLDFVFLLFFFFLLLALLCFTFFHCILMSFWLFVTFAFPFSYGATLFLDVNSIEFWL